MVTSPWKNLEQQTCTFLSTCPRLYADLYESNSINDTVTLSPDKSSEINVQKIQSYWSYWVSDKKCSGNDLKVMSVKNQNHLPYEPLYLILSSIDKNQHTIVELTGMFMSAVSSFFCRTGHSHNDTLNFTQLLESITWAFIAKTQQVRTHFLVFKILIIFVLKN